MQLPEEFLKFWFINSPRNLVAFFNSLNSAFLQLTSVGLLVKTYFKPWKNEYREGLVGFSIGMGIFIKTFAILADIVIYLALNILEILLIVFFLLWPVLTFFLLTNISIFLLSLLCILLIFFALRPKKSWVEQNYKKSTPEVVKNLLTRKDVLFVLNKAEIKKPEVQIINISKTILFNSVVGKTPLDVFKTYLISTEEKTKLLFNKQLKVHDLENIITFAKSVFPDIRKPCRVNFWGEGIGESWVSGWTLETSKYMIDITSEAVNKKPMLYGRDEEYKEAIEALSENKSCLLVGEPGSGRGSFVRGLAYESFAGNLKGNLRHQRFFELLADALLAGAQNQGQLEERLKNVIEEISHAGNVIIYIPSFENITGASTFNTDLSGALIPYLQRGIIRMIANITPASYKRFVEPKHTFSSVFEFIKFEEPGRETTFQMLLRKSLEIEGKNKVTISYKAIVAALNYARKYLQDRVLPGAAVVLLDDTANSINLKGKKIVEEQDVIDKVENKTKILVGKPKEKEKELLLNLEAKLHNKIIGQNEAIFEVSESLRRLRSGLGNTQKPISFLFLGPTGVGKTATAKAISDIYYGGENKMVRLDMSEYSTDDSVKRFLGGTVDAKGLTGMVSENPYSLVLLDEFEKSNLKIFDLFLQVLDDGRLTDNAGKTVSFADNIIIATSNAASEYIREEVNKGTVIDKNFQKNLLEHLQSKGIFRPEFLNRFDGIVVFKPLGKEEILKVIKLMLIDLSKKLSEKDIEINFDDKIVAKIADEGFDQEFGARPLQRFIQDNIEDQIAQKILRDEIKRGNKVSLSVDSANNTHLAVEG